MKRVIDSDPEDDNLSLSTPPEHPSLVVLTTLTRTTDCHAAVHREEGIPQLMLWTTEEKRVIPGEERHRRGRAEEGTVVPAQNQPESPPPLPSLSKINEMPASYATKTC